MNIVSESIKDIFKPKSKEEILSHFPPVFFDTYEKAKETYDLVALNSTKEDPYLSIQDYGHGYIFGFYEGNHYFQVLSDVDNFDNFRIVVFEKDQYQGGKSNIIFDFNDLKNVVNRYANVSESLRNFI